jgi:hypothetical protein
MNEKENGMIKNDRSTTLINMGIKSVILVSGDIAGAESFITGSCPFTYKYTLKVKRMIT